MRLSVLQFDGFCHKVCSASLAVSVIASVSNWHCLLSVLWLPMLLNYNGWLAGCKLWLSYIRKRRMNQHYWAITILRQRKLPTRNPLIWAFPTQLHGERWCVYFSYNSEPRKNPPKCNISCLVILCWLAQFWLGRPTRAKGVVTGGLLDTFRTKVFKLC